MHNLDKSDVKEDDSTTVCKQFHCLAVVGPTTQNPPLVRSCRAVVGPTTVLQLLNLKCWANVSVLPTTPTIYCPTLAHRFLAIWVGYMFL